MRPKLKISGISDLQDARYCAAVGIDLIAFTIEQGNPDAVTTAFVKEVSGWLEGPETVGEFGESDSVDYILECREKLHLQWISLPWEKYCAPGALDALKGKIILRKSSEAMVSDLAAFAVLIAENPGLCIEYAYTAPELFEQLLADMPDVAAGSILAFSDPDPVYKILAENGVKPFAFALGSFAKEESGTLDYNTCDVFVEKYESLAVS